MVEAGRKIFAQRPDKPSLHSLEIWHENFFKQEAPVKTVVLTCDKHAWVVPVFLHFYKKYWPDNPYETEIVTEKYHINGNVFYAGGKSWSTRLLNYIKQSKDDKFLFIVEDHLIRKTVDTERVKIAENLCEGKVGCVRLNNNPHKYFDRHTILADFIGFREYPLDKRFSMTLQMAIWQKQFLFDVLRDNESIWETEGNGSKRLKELKSPLWQILWPETIIIDCDDRGILRKGILEPPVLRWALSELSQDNPEYKILQNQIKRQKEGQ